MRRRALLTTVASSTVLAGCSGVFDESDTPVGPLYADGIEIADGVPASVTARIPSQPTESEPGTWEVRFRNGEHHRLYRFGWPGPMSTLVAEHVDEDARLYFQDLDSVDGRIDGCWTGDTNVVFAPPGTERNRFDMEPNRLLRAHNAVLAHPDNGGCIPSGVYRAAERYEVRDERNHE